MGSLGIARPSWRLAAGLIILSSPTCIWAQARSEKLDRQLERLRRERELFTDRAAVAADRRALWQYGAFFTAGYISLDDAFNENRVQRVYEAVAYARVNLDDAHEVFVRGRTGYQDFNDGDSFDGRGDEWIEADLERAYYRFDLASYLSAYQGREEAGNLTLQAGRDLVYWGTGLTLSETLDGISATLTSTGGTELSFIAGVTPTRTVDFDPSRPSFDHNTRRGFYGAMLRQPHGRHRPYVYGLIQRDYNKDYRTAIPAAEIDTQFEYNSYYLAIGSDGSFSDRLLYAFEAVYEGGKSLSNSFVAPNGFIVGVDQTRDDIHAWAFNARLDYLLTDPRDTRLSAEAIIASGDPDRGATNVTFGGNEPDTSDRAFNSLGFLNTGLAFSPAVSNLICLRAGVSSFPLRQFDVFDRLQAGADVFAFGKTDADAPIDEATRSGERYLGLETDLFMNWQVAEDLTFAVRYGVFFPGSAFDGQQDDIRQFIFVGVTYAF